MTEPFNIKQPVGQLYDHDLDDVRRTKQTLRDLGHFKTPDYGLTAYPDTPLFDGIKSYQRAKGLKEDGVMKPGGPTAAALGRDHATAARRGRTPGFVPQPGTAEAPYRIDAVPTPRPVDDTAFETRGDIGWGHQNDPDDVLAARRALAWAGHLPPNAARDQRSPGNDLFQALESFQRQAGVKQDGFMRPGGETAKALNDAIAPKVQAYLKRVAGKHEPTDGRGDDVQIAMTRRPKPGHHGATEGAMPQNPWTGGGGVGVLRSAAGAQEIRRQQRSGLPGGSEVPPPRPLDEPIGKHMPVPPLEVGETPKQGKEDDQSVSPITTEIPALEDPKIVHGVGKGNPDAIEELKKVLILESRGDARTKRLNNYCLEEMLKEARNRENVVSVRHVSGAVSREEGRLPESLRNSKPGLRGVRADAQVEVTMKDGTERIEEFQSIDHYADGETPDLREADAMDRIRQHKEFANELGDILATPKRRDLTEEEAMEICKEKVEEFADKHWGPRKAKQAG